MASERLTLAIRDLSCGDAPRLERALLKAKGVARAYINPLLETAYIEFDPATTDVHALVATVERAGFGAADIHTRRG